MAVIKAFFFDLDGTLINTHRANFFAYKKAIKQVVNFEADESLLNYIRNGESSIEFIPKVVKGIDADDLNKINELKKRLYPQHVHELELNEFLSTFLKQMYGQSQTVLVTTAKRENALTVLRHYELDRYFTHMLFGEDVVKMKPSPEVYVRALQLVKLDANEVIAFEDSPKGIEAAVTAGVNVVHIKDFL